MVLVSSISNFLSNKISHANKWMRKKMPTSSNSALYDSWLLSLNFQYKIWISLCLKFPCEFWISLSLSFLLTWDLNSLCDIWVSFWKSLTIFLVSNILSPLFSFSLFYSSYIYVIFLSYFADAAAAAAATIFLFWSGSPKQDLTFSENVLQAWRNLEKNWWGQ